MAPSQDEVYTSVQNIFQRGLVIVVGSGASCAYGLPSMSDLAEHLIAKVPALVTDLGEAAREDWARVEQALRDGEGLERALRDGVGGELADVVSNIVAERVRGAEEPAIAEILANPNVSALGKLFAHALRITPSLNVITTNYDRLVEVHAARASLPVDTMYFGHTIGRFDPERAGDEVLRAQTVVGRPQRTVLTKWPHLRLSKPHGSLDWFSHGDQHYRSDLSMPGSRRVIAPGGNKYRLGYDAPFDAQRERANREIDNSSALLFIGYGFNDEHLQTHLRPRFAQVPAVVLSRSLTESAREYLGTNPTSIGIEAKDDGCAIFCGETELHLDAPLWDPDTLVKEVLGV